MSMNEVLREADDGFRSLGQMAGIREVAAAHCVIRALRLVVAVDTEKARNIETAIAVEDLRKTLKNLPVETIRAQVEALTAARERKAPASA